MNSTPAMGDMNAGGKRSPHSLIVRLGLVLLTLILAAGVTRASPVLAQPVVGYAFLIACTSLALWLTELIPLYATTLFLVAATSGILGSLDSRFGVTSVLGWAANPVLVLFFCGFALSVSAEKYHIDAFIARLMLRVSRGSALLLLVTVTFGTGVLSMWMSKIAAAAMMFVALRSILNDPAVTSRVRTALILGVAFGANFGGMATPIGTGPNGIAMAAILNIRAISFLDWMSFALPLTLGMLLLTCLLIWMLYRVGGTLVVTQPAGEPLSRRACVVMAVFTFAVFAWVLEPFHHVPSAVVALVIVMLLFGSRLLVTADLARIDWGTLILIGGGIVLGELLDESGLARTLAGMVDWQSLPPAITLVSFVTASALLSSVASNTAAATLLIQLGLTVSSTPSFTILIAIAASFGTTFAISTPPNALAYGQGGLRVRDLFIPGVILMVIGIVLVSVTGPLVLGLFGIR